MSHQWQTEFGRNCPKRAYHNKEWAAKMREIGLQPTATGEVGGKETGASMTHYILDDGPYQRAYRKLRSQGFHLNWQSAPEVPDARKKLASKTKYTCPCGLNMW